jgi:putative tryptophan/tyrosine transport system substrate-binding protein
VIRRREFVTLLAGTAAVWSLSAYAQQGTAPPLIGMLMNVSETEPSASLFTTAFRQQLQELGWIDGRNVRIAMRWAGDASRYREYARELAALGPAVALAATTPAVIAMREAAPAGALVFVSVIDPVGSGLVASLARPGGNSTGFAVYEYAIAAKWLELLKEVGPGITRVAVIRDPAVAAGIGQFAAVQTVAPLGLELSVIAPQEADAFERAIATFASEPNGGLIVTAGQFAANNARLIGETTRRYKLPVVAPFRYFATAGGLISYGPDVVEPYRGAAQYIHRILKGEKPGNLPVQAPTKYQLILNLQTAKSLGIEIPASLLARADEVIE